MDWAGDNGGFTMRSSVPVRTSHEQMEPLVVPKATLVLPGEMEMAETGQVRSLDVLMSPPVCMSQSLAVQSLLPETSSVPSSEKAIHNIVPVCPHRGDDLTPVIASRSSTLDRDPTAMVSARYAKADGSS